MADRFSSGATAAIGLVSLVLVAAAFPARVGPSTERCTLGLPPFVAPSTDSVSADRIAIGRALFFDKRLSSDNSVACATCHDPRAAFSDPHARSVGVKGRAGERNSNTLLNVAFMEPLMWDGKAASLEEQSLLPFLSPTEFDLPPEDAVIKLRRQGYSELFKRAFGEDVSVTTLGEALAAYQRTLLAGDSPFDRYLFAHDETAISDDAKRGFAVFLQSKCDACHLIMTEGLHPFSMKHVMFTDLKFHNLGVDAGKPAPDAGRYDVTADPADWGRFRTPTLRNVSRTAPYFHDGSATTLEDVIEFYDRGGGENRNLDPAMKPLRLTSNDKRDLVRFLETLTTDSATLASCLANAGEPGDGS